MYEWDGEMMLAPFLYCSPPFVWFLQKGWLVWKFAKKGSIHSLFCSAFLWIEFCISAKIMMFSTRVFYSSFVSLLFCSLENRKWCFNMRCWEEKKGKFRSAFNFNSLILIRCLIIQSYIKYLQANKKWPRTCLSNWGIW